jgi:hypothetical protein
MESHWSNSFIVPLKIKKNISDEKHSDAYLKKRDTYQHSLKLAMPKALKKKR